MRGWGVVRDLTLFLVNDDFIECADYIYMQLCFKLFAAFMRGRGLVRDLTLFLVNDDFLEEAGSNHSQGAEYV